MLSLFDIPFKHAYAFWVIAVIISIYHATRAVVNQRRWRDDDKIHRQRNVFPLLPLWERIFVYYVHDAFFHIVCSMSGFVSAWTFALIFRSICNFADIGVGTSVLMGLLAIVAISGITGVLPPLLLYGKLWGKVSGQSN